MEISTDKSFTEKMDSYPDKVRIQMEKLHELIREAALENSEVTQLEETLKWGEPSFIAPKGSTLRMDWKVKSPNQYQLYFKCTSKLVSTFKAVYGDLFEYEKNRALVFQLYDKFPQEPVKRCVTAALNYHNVKHLPTLGM